MPQLEHPQRPQSVRMISPAATMLVQQDVYIFRVEIPALHKTLIREITLDAVLKLQIYPFVDRNAEALLFAMKDVRRHNTRYRFFENQGQER